MNKLTRKYYKRLEILYRLNNNNAAADNLAAEIKKL